MFSKSVAFAALAAAVAADLGKTPAYSDGLSPHYKFGDELPNVELSSQVGITIPQQCKDYAAMKNGDGSLYCDGDLTARRVEYNDCKGTFDFCVCNAGQGSTTQDIDSLISQFGRLPPAFKQNVRYVMGYTSESRWAETFVGPNDIIFFGNPSDDGMDVYLHEAGHALDHGNSSTQAWKDAINADGCAADDYGNSNEVEEFAQISVIKTWLSLHDNNPPDSTDIGCLKNQLAYFEGNAGLNNAALTIDACTSVKDGFIPAKRSGAPSRSDKKRDMGPSIACGAGRS